jgi:hypothetical protein
VDEAAQDDSHVTDLPLRECPASTPLPSSHPGGPRERRRGNQTGRVLGTAEREEAPRL